MLAVFLNLTQSDVDVFDHDLLYVEARDELADHGNRITCDELHCQPGMGTRFVVLREESQGLVELHRADRDVTDEAFVSLGTNEAILHNEWNVAESEAPVHAVWRVGIRVWSRRS